MTVRVNFGDILQAIEDKLVADGVVATASQIFWAVNGYTAHLVSQGDILLRARIAKNQDLDGGAWDLRFNTLVDVHLRTLSIKDPGGGNKAWIKSHFVLRDQVLDSIGKSDFIPKDDSGNPMTTQPLKAVNDLAPERRMDAETWGESILTLDVRSMPKVTPKSPFVVK